VGADAFWTERYTRVSRSPGFDPAAKVDPVLVAALTFFGDLTGRTLVDLGCGRGKASLFFARHGARVIAIDSSSVAIENLSHFCTSNEITNLEPVCASAFDVARYGPADLVFGSMVLHHLEPLAEFGLILRTLMKADAKAFFYENNGRNPLLMLLRRHVVGRFGIPKRGDPEESPLTPDEIDTSRRHFRVRVAYPEMLLMRLAAPTCSPATWNGCSDGSTPRCIASCRYASTATVSTSVSRELWRKGPQRRGNDQLPSPAGVTPPTALARDRQARLFKVDIQRKGRIVQADARIRTGDPFITSFAPLSRQSLGVASGHSLRQTRGTGSDSRRLEMTTA
jgi:SAM-dependent methyltransferase